MAELDKEAKENQDQSKAIQEWSDNMQKEWPNTNAPGVGAFAAFDIIAKKENAKQSISHRANKKVLIQYFEEILPNYDVERVYISDIKKVIQWYNAMQTAGLIELPQAEKKTTRKKATAEKEN